MDQRLVPPVRVEQEQRVEPQPGRQMDRPQERQVLWQEPQMDLQGQVLRARWLAGLQAHLPERQMDQQPAAQVLLPEPQTDLQPQGQQARPREQPALWPGRRKDRPQVLWLGPASVPVPAEFQEWQAFQRVMPERYP